MGVDPNRRDDCCGDETDNHDLQVCGAIGGGERANYGALLCKSPTLRKRNGRTLGDAKVASRT